MAKCQRASFDAVVDNGLITFLNSLNQVSFSIGYFWVVFQKYFHGMNIVDTLSLPDRRVGGGLY